MNPDLERLFHEAADLEPAARQRFLIEHCSDASLRAEVEQILEFDQGAEEFLGTPVRKLAARIEQEIPPTAAERIGPYRIIKSIGRGGMGAVYLAERLDGELTLRVAIKFVPIALRTEAVLERFRLERQILANLNHPNICRVLDAGTTEDGSPYLVMELIDGIAIDEWCRLLSPRPIVELFLKVCAAVQHAHQNLVIHRDLKPSNILVTPNGEPKLLDFGIAKLVDDADRNDQTMVCAMTPDYASPEQLAGEPITTATDIYGLGCVLYRLLTGGLPRPGSANPLKGDLKNILQHALDPEPECRYRTVQELAEDLRRFLAFEPVTATAQGWIYLARRFVRRKPVLAAALAALAISVAAGTTLSLWQAKRAERRFEEVRSLANVFLFRFEEQIRDISGTTSARQFVVNTALTYLERLARDSRNDPALRLELAGAYRKVSEVQYSGTASSLGDMAGATASLQRARAFLPADDANPAVREESARVLLRTGDIKQDSGELEAGLRLGREAQALADQWLKAEPRNPAAMEIGSQSQVLVGRVLRRLNRLEEARLAIERAVSIDRLAVESYPGSEETSLRIASDLGWLASIEQSGQPEEAISRQREALDILQKLKQAHGSSAAVDRALMVGMSRMAALLQNAVESLAYLDRASKIAQNRVAMDRQDTRALMDLQSVLTRQGSALLDAGKSEEARRTLLDAVGLSRRLAERDPANREAKLNLGIALGAQAETLTDAQAVGLRQEARGIYLSLLKSSPSDAKVLYPYAYNQAALVGIAAAHVQLCEEGFRNLGKPTEDSGIEAAYRELSRACRR